MQMLRPVHISPVKRFRISLRNRMGMLWAEPPPLASQSPGKTSAIWDSDQVISSVEGGSHCVSDADHKLTSGLAVLCAFWRQVLQLVAQVRAFQRKDWKSLPRPPSEVLWEPQSSTPYSLLLCLDLFSFLFLRSRYVWAGALEAGRGCQMIPQS